MRVRIKENIAILVLLHFLTNATMAFAEVQWLFNSIYGQPLWISYEPKESLYTLTLGDVTEKVKSCGSASLRLCFKSNVVDVAIPEKEPKVGEKWGDIRTSFSLVGVIENLELLGESHKKVLIISVKKNLRDSLGGSGTRSFRLFYSYNDGLIAFQEESDQGGGTIFIASRLPSLGALR